jgi:hypothetical protein
MYSLRLTEGRRLSGRMTKGGNYSRSASPAALPPVWI